MRTSARLVPAGDEFAELLPIFEEALGPIREHVQDARLLGEDEAAAGQDADLVPGRPDQRLPAVIARSRPTAS
jgi:hypothetical protein